MSLQQRFQQAVDYVRSPPKDGPVKLNASNEDKLKFYSLYKQATEGKCTTSRPGMFSPVERAKWDAWNELGDMSKEAAMEGYIAHLNSLLPGTIK